MWLKEINNMLVPPPVNYVTDEGITIINFNKSETAMLANGWRDWTEQEIEEWEATHPAPEPPAKPYYTKTQVDELIAGVEQEIPEAPVQSDWDESDSETLSYIQNKPEIPAAQVQADWDESDSTAVDYIKNKPTIPTTASEVGAMKFDGLIVEALTSDTIPAAGKIYTYAPDADTTFVFPTPDAASENLFEIDLTMPDPAVTVTWPSGLVWKFATPTLSAGSTTALRFRYTGSNWEGGLHQI